MIAYLVERVYSDPTRPNAMLSIWSSFERAQAWAERHRADAADADLAIRVREIARQRTAPEADGTSRVDGQTFEPAGAVVQASR